MSEKTFTQEEVNNIVSARLKEYKEKNENEYKLKYDALVAQLEAEKTESGYKARFDGVVKDTAFINDLTREGVYSKFKQALAEPENSEKTDEEIYNALVKDKNYFENPNRPADMVGINKSGCRIRDEDFQIMAAMGIQRGGE